ncbi:MAG: PilZ domain-containing protein [Candidatus Omnitrophota bacterium]|jgi:hypothetical protein
MEYSEEIAGSFEDQRLFERIPVTLPVKYTDLDSCLSGEAVLSDISAYGLGMVTGVDLQLSTRLEIWLKVPDQGQPVYTRGKVVWSSIAGMNSHRMGVSLERTEFMSLSRLMRIH